MVTDGGLIAVARQVTSVLDEKIPGSLVECGVWRGGVSLLMATLVKERLSERRVYLCDSFEGLPSPEPIDGTAANNWAQRTDDPWYHNNCQAGIDDVRRLAKAFDVDDTTVFVPGWFADTLPRLYQEVSEISYLRIDADWHASVLTCLEHLYDRVVPGGYVVFDDYDTWDGCAIAVHEFLGTRRLPHRILRDGCAYFRKS